MFVVITNESKIILSIGQTLQYFVIRKILVSISYPRMVIHIFQKNINQGNTTVFTVMLPFTDMTLRQYKGAGADPETLLTGGSDMG
jgi:hypothetical protein